jgi:hypothetical protein
MEIRWSTLAAADLQRICERIERENEKLRFALPK